MNSFFALFRRQTGHWLLHLIIMLVFFAVGISSIYFALGRDSGVTSQTLFRSPILYVGLGLIIAISIFRALRMGRSGVRRILLITSVLLMGAGFLFIVLAYSKGLWQSNPNYPAAYDPGVFGAGITVVALGFAVLSSSFPLASGDENLSQENLHKLNEKISKISGEADSLEKALLGYEATVKNIQVKITLSSIDKTITDVEEQLGRVKKVLNVFLDHSNEIVKDIDNAMKE